jgi:ribonuclease R
MFRLEGRVSVHVRGFGFVEFEREGEAGSAFVAPPDLLPFLESDRVEATIAESAPGKLQATDLKLVERTRTSLFGTITSRNGKPHVKIDREVGNADWAIADSSREGFAEGTHVVGEIEGQKLTRLRVIAPADASLARVVVRHGLRTEFPAEVLAAARAKVALDMEGRRDLRSLPTVTIDAPVSKDLDDALSVLPAAPDGAIRLFVSIADVDALVPAGSVLDLEAQKRATSVYLAGQVIPMLPRELSEEALSLLPGEDRPAMTAELRIDPEGTVRAIDVYPSLIRSHARLDYDGVAAFLDMGDESEIPAEVRTTVRWLRTAAARVAVTRAARGGVTLLAEEAYVTVDEHTREVTSIGARASTSAHLLIERLMVAANEAIATWLIDRGLPGVFRVHDTPDDRAVASLAAYAHNFGFEAGFGKVLTPLALSALEQQFTGHATEPAMRNVLGRVLGPARYTVHPSIHFGLAAPRYLHFTSPIRRYADLAVHRIVKGYLAGKRDLHAGDESLENLSRHLNDAAFRATKAENERVRMLAARHFAKRVGETFRGNVVAVKPFGLVVQLVGLAVSGTIAVDALPGNPRVDLARRAIGNWSIGDALEVKVVGTNVEVGRIDLALA